MKIKTIIDFASNKELVDIRKMIEEDWKVEVPFFHQMTGIDHDFFLKYFTTNLDFDLQKIVSLPTHVSKKK
ncbi:hypothetical protein D1872_326330 [compost metagenome]